MSLDELRERGLRATEKARHLLIRDALRDAAELAPVQGEQIIVSTTSGVFRFDSPAEVRAALGRHEKSEI